MTVTIKIRTDNAAFEPEPNNELARILSELADGIDCMTIEPGVSHGLYDVNGNHVGELKTTKR